MRTFDLLLRLLRIEGGSPGQERLASVVRPYMLAPFLEFALNRSTQEDQSGQSEEEGRQVKLVSVLSELVMNQRADEAHSLDLPISHFPTRRVSAHAGPVASRFRGRARRKEHRRPDRRSTRAERGHAASDARIRTDPFQIPRGERALRSSGANVMLIS